MAKKRLSNDEIILRRVAVEVYGLKRGARMLGIDHKTLRQTWKRHFPDAVLPTVNTTPAEQPLMEDGLKICRTPFCGMKHHAKGLCRSCYNKKRINPERILDGSQDQGPSFIMLDEYRRAYETFGLKGGAEHIGISRDRLKEFRSRYFPDAKINKKDDEKTIRRLKMYLQKPAMTFSDIARQTGISYSVVKRYLKKLGYIPLCPNKAQKERYAATRRERMPKILAGRKQGKTYKEISQDLGVAQTTVMRYVLALKGRYDVSSKSWTTGKEKP